MAYGWMGVAAQNVPLHVDNVSVYEFLDELAGMGAIDLNSAVKPYSRIDIAGYLMEASDFEGLSSRQQEEVKFFLRDFGKDLTANRPEDKSFDLFYYSDSLFRFTLNPIAGVEFFSAGGKSAYHRWHGGEFQGTIGKHLGFYGSLRDNYESELLGGRSYLQQRRGSIYKGDQDAQDYSETRGGLTWSWNWGSVGIHKDHFVWGSGYNGTNIFSGHTPSFGFVSFKMKPVSWFEFSYVHGALVSEVVDTLRSYEYYKGTREVFANKYIAANIFTFRPVPRLHVSVGNSVVYGDIDMNPVYMLPFLFYKSADHTYNAASNNTGQNAQMYFDISSRQINHLHLYSSVFIDEISTKRMFNKETQSNYVSMKAGARLTGLPPDFVATLEYSRTNPMVYQHIIPTTTYESNGYTMGHYLKDNSDELFLELRYKPLRGLDLGLSYTNARKGKDYQSILIAGEEALHPEINTEEPRWGLPFMSEVRWKMQKIAFCGSYQIINRGIITFKAEHNDFSGPDTDLYTVPYLMEGPWVISLGMNYGF
jgi:hypothetical protein